MDYQILTNINHVNSHQLQKYIDNKNGNKMVALKSIIYWIGWYNVEEDEYISVNGKTTKIDQGRYTIENFVDIFEKHSVVLYVRKNSGLAVLTIPQNTYVKITNGILLLLGFKTSEKFKYVEFPSVNKEERYVGYKSVNFEIPKELRICIDQLDTDTNCLDGAPSNILEILPSPGGDYGSVVSVRFIPYFKKLVNGYITELTVCLKDENNKPIKNNGQNITVELCIK